MAGTRTGVAAGIALFALTLTACDLPATAGKDSNAPLPSDSSAQLASLKIGAAGPMTGYSRDRFGGGWITQPDGCDTRADVLKAQGTGVQSKGCTVTSGKWLSLYDGQNVTSPHDLDIDHLVPEAEAWRTGAAQWTQDQRVAFANDLDELVAVTAHSNRSKGDQPPPGYMPAVRTEWCDYATHWIKVKAKYKLTISQSERDALTRMLGTCH
ncbi:HNH endonuclease family protein [Kutzneria buriramensis]|uniref:Uncharacterized protein DUF1524 n=1 Tax=Kutzneria buriramensis TaxID=1045776 RepID=A0A3E0H0X4_9PSEU|nr:HNH endonuclease family protein [Kutzneria buriramensis]REH36305.1 uncharacterized protein DUF1524 [Kutzneria buriramensis]